MREKVKLNIKGMYCTGCETRILNVLSQIDGIYKVNASYKDNTLEIEYENDKVNMQQIENKLDDLDYHIVKNKENKSSITIIYILIIIFALYIILNHLGMLKIFNVFPTINSTMSYGMLFIIGLLTSIHCIAMCGGINLSQSTMSVKNNSNNLKANFLYNLGRVISYTIIGGIVGLIGSVITLGGKFRGVVAILAGFIMLIMSINMLGIFPKLKKFNIIMPKFIIKLFGKIKNKSSFYIGLINGFMPCGPLQTMQVYALSTGSSFRGAFSMLVFSLGTVPLMFLFGVISGKLNKKFTKVMLTISSIVIFILSLSMIGNGFALSGINIYNSTSNEYENLAEIVDDRQVVYTNLDYASFGNITVKKDIPVKWTIYVEKEKLNGCNNEILIPEFNIDVKLNEGENVIEFTPNEEGSFIYSCWMGMIKNTIQVID